MRVVPYLADIVVLPGVISVVESGADISSS